MSDEDIDFSELDKEGLKASKKIDVPELDENSNHAPEMWHYVSVRWN